MVFTMTMLPATTHQAVATQKASIAGYTAGDYLKGGRVAGYITDKWPLKES